MTDSQLKQIAVIQVIKFECILYELLKAELELIIKQSLCKLLEID